MEKQNIDPNDILRSRFTSWLTALLRRARIDYVRQQSRQVETVSLEDVDEAQYAVEDQPPLLKSEFEFEEERLAQAFFSLPLKRQQVLTMLFVHCMAPAEIAKELRCSVDYVYKLRERALQALRKMLGEEGLQ